MVENADTNPSEEGLAEEEGLTLGGVLRAAREEQDLTLEQVAEKLRVEPRFLSALEEDRFGEFIAPVFVKGHLKQLGRRYGLEYADLLARYTRQTAVHDAPATDAEPARISAAPIFSKLIVSRRSSALPKLVTPRRPSALPWLIAGSILALGAAAIWYRWDSGQPLFGISGEEPAPSGAEESAASAPPPEAAEPEALPVPENPEDAPAVPAADSPASAVPAADSPAPAVPAAGSPTSAPTLTAGPTIQVAIRFDDDCWTEVYGGNGETLYYGLGQTGAAADFDGALPVSFTFGNAAGVRMSIDDQLYSLPAPQGSGDSVRFVVTEAP